MGAWAKFLQDISAAREKVGLPKDCRDPAPCYMRGQSNSDWPLMPSLLRTTVAEGLIKKRHRKRKQWDACAELESDLYWDFESRARAKHPDLSSWDVLYAMQHFGAPTRLLDWTEVLGIAVFFAIWDHVAGRTPCVWVLNPIALNNAEWPGTDDLISPRYLGGGNAKQYEELLVAGGKLWWDRPIAIFPDLKNDRILAQHGSFTIHGNRYVPMEEDFPERKGILTRVCLAENAIPEARDFLTHAGIDRFALFPDLDGLALALREKHGVQGASGRPDKSRSAK